LAIKRKKNYNAGRDFEYKVMTELREQGWIVKRAYASKGIFDLIAYKDDVKWGIQCKSLSANKNRAYLSPKENKELIEYSKNPSEVYEFVQWSKPHHCPVMRELKEVFTVVHCYNTFPGMKWIACFKGHWAELEMDKTNI
jgi:Holliday junction resolvase